VARLLATPRWTKVLLSTLQARNEGEEDSSAACSPPVPLASPHDPPKAPLLSPRVRSLRTRLLAVELLKLALSSHVPTESDEAESTVNELLRAVGVNMWSIDHEDRAGQSRPEAVAREKYGFDVPGVRVDHAGWSASKSSNCAVSNDCKVVAHESSTARGLAVVNCLINSGERRKIKFSNHSCGQH
jgi:hypothetical protein